MSVARRIVAFLDLAVQDVDAAKTLASTRNRYAAYHCQQAAEKLIKAVLLHRSIESGTEHRLDVLVDKLPDDDPWKPSFARWTSIRPTRRRSAIRRLVAASLPHLSQRRSPRMQARSRR